MKSYNYTYLTCKKKGEIYEKKVSLIFIVFLFFAVYFGIKINHKTTVSLYQHIDLFPTVEEYYQAYELDIQQIDDQMRNLTDADTLKDRNGDNEFIAVDLDYADDSPKRIENFPSGITLSMCSNDNKRGYQFIDHFIKFQDSQYSLLYRDSNITIYSGGTDTIYGCIFTNDELSIYYSYSGNIDWERNQDVIIERLQILNDLIKSNA